jgi:putative PIN family toxin of toxin-antitoxin system
MKTVIDTNIVLDLFIFDDAVSKPLKAALQAGSVQWLATQVMRDELERVLAYTHLQPRMAFYNVTAADVLAQFDRHAQLHAIAPRATAICKDADDQKFIDLAVQHQALLLSKDKAVLCMRKRLLSQGIRAQAAIELIATEVTLSA